jgi:citrate lyase subunit beta / citryl-CoA lyase
MTSSTAAESIRSTRNIPAEIARSWLLVNAMKTELFDQSASSRADAIMPARTSSIG